MLQFLMIVTTAVELVELIIQETDEDTYEKPSIAALVGLSIRLATLVSAYICSRLLSSFF